MIGAGVFVGLSPAVGLAGRWMLVGLAVAALTAVCTACSTTDLARACPGIGGGYRYARDLLGRWPGRMAGGVGLLGRIAGIAAVAGCFGAYVVPQRPLLGALGALALAVVAEIASVRLPVPLGRVLVGLVLVVLAVVVVACFAVPAVRVGAVVPDGVPGADNPVELLPAAGVLFFGFLGGAGGSAGGVVERGGRGGKPGAKVVVPVLILITLGTYLAVGTALLRELGPTRTALSPAPLRDALAVAGASALAPILTAGIAAATISGLFALVSGARQTAKAMADAGDLPGVLGTGGIEHTVVGTLGIGVVGAVAVLLLSPVTAIELAATCGLFAAAFTNAAARLLERHERVWPARTACLGLALSVLLVIAMPPIALTLSVLAMGIGAAIGPLVSLRRHGPVHAPPRHARALKI